MLLLDHNLSYKLVNDQELNLVFPGLQHVYLLGMYDEEDDVLWGYAAKNGLIIVSKDYDFQQLQLTKGSPPPVVKISIGNCTNERIRQLLLSNEKAIKNLPYNQYGLMDIVE